MIDRYLLVSQVGVVFSIVVALGTTLDLISRLVQLW
jgi:hypothetical protein